MDTLLVISCFLNLFRKFNHFYVRAINEYTFYVRKFNFFIFLCKPTSIL